MANYIFKGTWTMLGSDIENCLLRGGSLGTCDISSDQFHNLDGESSKIFLSHPQYFLFHFWFDFSLILVIMFSSSPTPLAPSPGPLPPAPEDGREPVLLVGLK